MSLPKIEDMCHQDLNMVDLIIDRAKRESAGTNSTIDKADRMDLKRCLAAYHLVNPLDLDKLWKAPLYDLLHDIHGAHSTILGDMRDFVARYSVARPEEEELGQWLVELLNLQPDKNGIYQTDAGPKTLIGLGQAVKDHFDLILG